jgi:acetoin utilization deacetylase AcuC-like enzyme
MVYADTVIPQQQVPKEEEAAVPEDPDGEFGWTNGEKPRLDGPRIINVGVPGPGVKATLWRRSWRDKILPAVVNFAPHLILISAGFDAHRKDEINFQFVGVREHDFAWVTDQIVQVFSSDLVDLLCFLAMLLA